MGFSFMVKTADILSGYYNVCLVLFIAGAIEARWFALLRSGCSRWLRHMLQSDGRSTPFRHFQVEVICRNGCPEVFHLPGTEPKRWSCSSGTWFRFQAVEHQSAADNLCLRELWLLLLLLFSPDIVIVNRVWMNTSSFCLWQFVSLVIKQFKLPSLILDLFVFIFIKCCYAMTVVWVLIMAGVNAQVRVLEWRVGSSMWSALWGVPWSQYTRL